MREIGSESGPLPPASAHNLAKSKGPPPLAVIWRISLPYFNSDDRWAGRGLLAAVIAIELSTVYLTVLFNKWNNVFYNALRERDQAGLTYQIGYFCVLAAFWVGLKVYQLYLNQWLQIRWRNWMTTRYLGGWI